MRGGRSGSISMRWPSPSRTRSPRARSAGGGGAGGRREQRPEAAAEQRGLGPGEGAREAGGGKGRVQRPEEVRRVHEPLGRQRRGRGHRPVAQLVDEGGGEGVRRG